MPRTNPIRQSDAEAIARKGLCEWKHMKRAYRFAFCNADRAARILSRRFETFIPSPIAERFARDFIRWVAKQGDPSNNVCLSWAKQWLDDLEIWNAGGFIKPTYPDIPFHTATMHVFSLAHEETREQLQRLVQEDTEFVSRVARSKLFATVEKVQPINRTTFKVTGSDPAEKQRACKSVT